VLTDERVRECRPLANGSIHVANVWDEHFQIDAVVLASGELAAHATKAVATSPDNKVGDNSSTEEVEAAAVAEVTYVSTNVLWGLFSATGPASLIPQLPGCSVPAAAPPTQVYQPPPVAPVAPVAPGGAAVATPAAPPPGGAVAAAVAPAIPQHVLKSIPGVAASASPSAPWRLSLFWGLINIPISTPRA
jgi:hypothetical protein